MPLSLNADCRKRMIEQLTRDLPRIEVRNGKFLDPRSCFAGTYHAEKALPDHGSIRKELAELVSDFPFVDFVNGSLTFELLEGQEYTEEPASQPLTSIGPYTSTEDVANRLVDSFASLPWRYMLTVKAPKEVSELFATFIRDVRISPTIRLVTSSPEFAAEFPLNSDNPSRQSRIHARGALSILRPDEVREWEDSCLYIQLEATGFIGPYGGTIPHVNANDQLKSLCGLGIAFGIFDVHHQYSASPPTAKFYVHKRVGEHWELDTSITFSHDLARAFATLTHAKAPPGVSEPAEWLHWLIDRVEDIKAVCSSKAARTLLACRWLFDSHTATDELTGYVHAMVVLEILLGDKASSKQIGLGELLRNRCAYLIGKTHKERETLLDEFNKIYDVRSQIVHNGKSRLSASERTLFRRLHELCARVVVAEANLIKADASTT